MGRGGQKKLNFSDFSDVTDSGRLMGEDEEGCECLRSSEATCVWRLCHLAGMER